MTRPFVPTSRSRPAALLAVLLAALAIAAASCSRALPSAPANGNGGPSNEGAEQYDPGTIAGQVVVTMATGVDAQRLASDYGATLAETESECYGTVALVPAAGMTPDTLAARLALDPRVITSERDAVFQTAEAAQQSFGFDDGFGSAQAATGQPAITVTGFRTAHAVSRGTGVTIAILDTGIDPTHPLFAGRIAGGWDFVDNDADPTDVGAGIAYGHGTHVAGIAAMAAPEAKLLIARVLDATGSGDMRNVAAGIRWAVAHGARVINLSLGSLSSSEAVSNALEQAKSAGAVVVAAAGNRATDNPSEYPARSSEAVAIAAADDQGHAATFTSYGSFVAMTAPGVLVRSAYPGGRWYLWSGSSMSTPFVAGTAALLLALHPTWGQQEVEARLQQSASPVSPATSAMVGKLGAGELDAAAALAPDTPPGQTAGNIDPVLLPQSKH